MLGRDRDLESGSFGEGCSYGRAWDILCGLIVLRIILGIGILVKGGCGVWELKAAGFWV